MSDGGIHSIENGTGLIEIKIRRMVKEDTGHYCELFKDVFSQHPWNENWTISEIDAVLTRLMRKKEFVGLVAESATGTIGYLTGFRLRLFPSLCYLDQLFVHVDYQGKKAGKALLYEAVTLFNGFGSSKLFLLTKPKSAAEKFYLHCGFKPFLPAIRIKGKSILSRNL